MLLHGPWHEQSFAQVHPARWTVSHEHTRPLELVHLDISGKVEESLHGFLYSASFLDDYTAKSDVYLLKQKSELFNCLNFYKERSERELQVYRYRLTKIRLDRAGENLSNSVNEFCAALRLTKQWSCRTTYSRALDSCKSDVILSTLAQLQYLWLEAIIHANWLRNRLPASRIQGAIPIRSWDPKSRVDYTSLLEVGTPGFAFIYRKQNVSGKKFLPRSVFGYFVGMASETVLLLIFIPQTKAFIQVRRNDFRKYDGTDLPGVEALLDGIARQVEKERTEGDSKNIWEDEENNALLIDAFVDNHALLTRCLATKKKFDPNVPRSFNEACQYPRWCVAIDREYNALVRRRTWRYIRRQPGMRL